MEDTIEQLPNGMWRERRWVGTDGEYTETWLTPPPDLGVRYRVIEQEWNADFTERTIKRVELA